MTTAEADLGLIGEIRLMASAHVGEQVPWAVAEAGWQLSVDHRVLVEEALLDLAERRGMEML